MIYITFFIGILIDKIDDKIPIHRTKGRTKKGKRQHLEQKEKKGKQPPPPPQHSTPPPREIERKRKRGTTLHHSCTPQHREKKR